MATLVVNKLKGTLQAAAVKAVGFGDRRKALLENIAGLAGGQVVSEDSGIKLENVAVSDLGKAKRINIDKYNTTITIVDGAGSQKVQKSIPFLMDYNGTFEFLFVAFLRE